MAHCSFVEVNNATRLQRSNIIYFDDDLLIDTLDQRISSPAAMDATKLFTQTSLDRSGPRRRVVALAGSCLCAALPISGPIGIVCRCCANNRGVMGGPFGSSHCGRGTNKHDSCAANYGAQAHHHFRYSLIGAPPAALTCHQVVGVTMR